MTTSSAPRRTRRRIAIAATLTGILGFLLALASAVLPVQQTVATINWSQTKEPTGIVSPSSPTYRKTWVVTLPVAASPTPTNSLLFSTIPASSADAGSEGLQIRRAPTAPAPTLSPSPPAATSSSPFLSRN
ncbi:MAG: hypothetical protein U1U88_001100 [Lawsonella clevelandensis]